MGSRQQKIYGARDPRTAATILRWLAMRAEPEPITPARPPPDPHLDQEDDEPAEARQEECDWAA